MDSRSTSDSFPGFEHLYSFGRNGDSKWFRAKFDGAWDDFELTRQGSRLEQPVRATWSMGSKSPEKVVWAGVVGTLLANSIVDELTRVGARGWSTYDVDLRNARGEQIAGYSGLSVHGRCGPIQNEKSVEVMRRFPAGLFPVWKGLYFDHTSWDGSDFFVPEMRGCRVIVTERVKSVFEAAAVPHVAFDSLIHFERSKVEMSMKA